MFHVEPFFDPATFTLTYVVYDPNSKDAVVIDSVLDYEPMSSTVSTASVETIAAFLEKAGLTLRWTLETHAHADHLTATPWLKKRFGGRSATGVGIREVQKVFKTVFDMPPTFRTDGSQFDLLLEDGQILEAGTLRIETISTPGHTPGCVSYHIGDAVFTGDALFIEDYGTGRCDFPEGSADALYTSVHDKLYALPDETRVFVGHDYQPGGRPMRAETTIGRSKRENIQLRADTTRPDFVALRNARDATLAAPRLLWQSVQVNIDAGRLPAEHENGVRYLRIPLNLRKPVDDDGARKGASAS
ncbi:MBL fold metallo-hydrolase [Polyangium mundeleinium]|uniref:MBL fold metallo-hydrolase n=1 Tax=Polyangium mundeleinium TaxID=2995306 RepID=A0ABT5EW94_9BACT|nr:MBL fold metallo-hydrolase [Polyangium mundeleinium]MDC0746086.1 MBL fold metallo-hydrolase [Polyangium mundeleinium]